MNDIEFKWLTEPLAVLLTGKGVFVASVVITVIFGFIYHKNKSRQLLNSLPGLFTSLGLLGTFVAICNSLGDINQDTLEIDTIITQLVPAFTSSIAGLISAFKATAGCKIWYSFEDKKLDGKVENKSPEECLYALTQSSEETNAKLSTIVKQMDDQIDKTNGKLSTISQQLIDQAAKNET